MAEEHLPLTIPLNPDNSLSQQRCGQRVSRRIHGDLGATPNGVDRIRGEDNGARVSEFDIDGASGLSFSRLRVLGSRVSLYITLCRRSSARQQRSPLSGT